MESDDQHLLSYSLFPRSIAHSRVSVRHYLQHCSPQSFAICLADVRRRCHVDFVRLLPPELVMHIFKHVTLIDLIHCTMVNGGWNRKLTTEHMWTHQLQSWDGYARGDAQFEVLSSSLQKLQHCYHAFLNFFYCMEAPRMKPISTGCHQLQRCDGQLWTYNGKCLALFNESNKESNGSRHLCRLDFSFHVSCFDKVDAVVVVGRRDGYGVA